MRCISFGQERRFGLIGYMALAVLCAVPTHGQGQNPPPGVTPPSPAAAAPAGQSTTAAVDKLTLDIVARDKRHKPVMNLQPGDFSVADDGKPVQLSDLHLVTGKSDQQHLVTLVFDRFHGATAKDAQSIARKIVKMVPSTGYSFAVFDIAGRLRLIQGFTGEHDVLDHAIYIETDSKPVHLKSTWTQTVDVLNDRADPARATAADEARKNLLSIVRTGADSTGKHLDVTERARYRTLLAALQDSQKVMVEQHGRPALAALMGLVRSEERISGRKTIVYFTSNMHLDSSAKEMVRSITGAAAGAGVTFYIIDMDALNAGTEYQLQNAMGSANPPYDNAPVAVAGSGGMASVTPTQQPGGYGFATGLAGATSFMMRSDEYSMFANAVKNPLASLATGTGGEYIDGQNSLGRPLHNMLSDFTTYYEASYLPPVQNYDGSFRTIALKPLRKGLGLRSQTGYFAIAPGAEAGIRPFEVPVLKALTLTPLPQDFKFNSAVLRFGDVNGIDANTVAIDVPLSQLQVQKDARTNLFLARAAIVAEIRDKSGVEVEHFAEDVTRRGALETLDRDPLAVLTLQRNFSSTPGQYTLEAAVLDRNSGKVSARKVQFEVREQPANTPAVSDIAVVRRMEPIHDTDDDAIEPMQYERGRIVANVSGKMSPNSRGVSLYFVLHPASGSKVPPVLQMQVIHDSIPGRRTALPLTLKPGADAVRYLASFGSGSLAPGDYEVRAYVEQDGKTITQSTHFMVDGNGKNAAVAPGTETTLAAGPAFVPSAADRTQGELVITVPKDPMPPLGQQDARQLVEDARVLALKYNDALPNFMCVEVTNRSVDPGGEGRWKLQDSILELLRYRNKQESRMTLEVNGQRSTVNHAAMSGALSQGEFGGALRTVFSPQADAHFTWRETNELNGGTVQVFDYKVEQEHSMFGVVGTDNREKIAGFHGQAFIDSSTHSVRRITEIADDLPEKFSTHYSSLAVDYDYVAIDNHDFLLPISAEMRLVKGRHYNTLNSIEFRNYRRYGSQFRILNYAPVSDAAPRKK